MFEFYKKIVSSPILGIVLLVCIIILFFGISNTVTNVATMFGFDTKENLQTKVDKTNIELNKAIEVNKENIADDKLNKAITEITETVDVEVKEKEVVIDSNLDNIYKEIEAKTKEVKYKEVKPPSRIITKATKKQKAKEVVINKEVLDNGDAYALEMIVNRHNTFKGLK